jgi:MFS family permease
MGSVLAPAMVARVFLLPVCGPIADQVSRKKLLVVSDLWRFLFSAAIFTMVCFNSFHLPALILCYVLLSFGSALFSASLGGLIPRIVSRENLQVATQQSQALNSFGTIAGGVLGGTVVSIFGVKGAFGIDALSFLVAAIFTGFIQADTKPLRVATVGFAGWKRDFLGGFRILRQVPLLFWLCLIAMFMNLCLAPLSVVLPVLVKEARGMPAWFLGGLESSIALGSILGAISLGYGRRFLSGRGQIMVGIAMIAIGVLLLPWVPNLALPLMVLLWVGVGSSWANIPIGTQVSLTVPDSYRGRLGAIMGFLCSGVAPLGVAVAGMGMAYMGLSRFLFTMGSVVILLDLLILAIPHMKEFLEVTPEDANGFFERAYPGSNTWGS